MIYINELFIVEFALTLSIILWWSFRTLPQEKWQIMFSMPLKKNGDDQWHGLNLTYYGFFVASSNTLAVTLIFILLGSLSVPVTGIFLIAASLLILTVPASKLVALIVEKKSSTLSVGGAAFIGIIIAPWVLLIIQWLLRYWMGYNIDVLAVMSVIALAYAFGEGMGRLACISFGCCYGKPLSEVNPFMRKIFTPLSFIFTGKTKKIAYAHGLDCQKVIPVQAITSIIYITTGIVSLYLFLNNNCRAAFIIAISITQLWRFFSEFLRADYRGEGRISAYQIMGVAAFIYAVFIAMLFNHTSSSRPDILTGLHYLWNPLVIISLQCFWFLIFLFTGRSQVTESTISFHVVREKI